MKTSSTTRVAEKVIELGRASVDDLVKYFPELTRVQIMRAMDNAKYRKLIVTIEPGKRLGHAKGVSPSVAGPRPKVTPSKSRFSGVSSVFDLGRLEKRQAV